MPGGTTFELLINLDHIRQIIFITAYQIHVIRVLEINAPDYLLKPIEENRLAHSLKRIHSQKDDIGDVQKNQNTTVKEEKLFIKDGECCRPLFLRSLNQLEKKLEASIFNRSRRQHIVNFQFV